MPAILPRFIRLRDAPLYLGIDRNRFNREVRPYIEEIPIGRQGIAFDRLDLDAWADDYKRDHARPARARMPSTSNSEKPQFEKALEVALSKTRK